MVIEKQPETPSENEEMGFAPFRRGDFVLLTDDVQCKLIRFEEIFFLQAYRNYTLVYFSGGKLWVRTALKDCESRLDRSTFFRASRGCLVNVTQVRTPRLLENGRLLFVLGEGKEVVLSRRRTTVFRDKYELL